jgi:hypothetical protein
MAIRISLFLIIGVFLSSSLSSQEIFKVGDLEMTFEKSFIELGKVKRGDVRKFEYKFKNTGKVPIKIEIVSGCDCTTTDWPRRPIMPGIEAIIPITFDSTEKEKSETVDVDIYLENEDPKSGNPILKIVSYSFELVL